MSKKLSYVVDGEPVASTDLSAFDEAVRRGFWAQYPTEDGMRRSAYYAPTYNDAMDWLVENYPNEFTW